MNKQQKSNLTEWTFLVLITESLVALLYFWLILGSATVANVMLAVTAVLVLILGIIVLVRSSSFFPNWAAWGGVVFGAGMLISYYLDADLISNPSAILIPIIALGVAIYLRLFFKHEEEREQRNQQELKEVRHENERLFAQAGNVKQIEPTDATVIGEQVKSDVWSEQR
jgi:prepilin signal peptidase PulO-like enzyme (type II secretory pathway)